MRPLRSLVRKLEKAVAVSGVCSGVPEENSAKIPGNCWKIFPESRNATNSRISGGAKLGLEVAKGFTF